MSMLAWEPSFNYGEADLAAWAERRGWTVTRITDLRVEAERPTDTPGRHEVIAWERLTSGAWRIDRHGYEKR